MTTLELVPLSETEETDEPDDLVHWYCPECYPDGERAYCGKALSGVDGEDAGEVECEACLVIDECPKCEW